MPPNSPSEWVTIDKWVVMNVDFADESDSPLPEPLRIGISVGTRDRRKTAKAVITPQSQAQNFTISNAGTQNNAISIDSQSRQDNVWTFRVAGENATPVGTPGGDGVIAATHTSGAQKTHNVVVVVPAKIATPHPTANGAVNGVNMRMDAESTPPEYGLPDGKVLLATAYFHWQTITVWDQFDQPIGSLYAGAPVTEYNEVDIHQQLSANSTYTDPVGRYLPVAVVDANSQLAQNWPTYTKFEITTTASDTTTTPVQVDGFALDPAVVNRTISWSPPNRIQITWPD